jgi:glutamate-1-semialdehyde 2,1-aminomutase
MPAKGDLNRDLICRLHEREVKRFRDSRPTTLALLERARTHMPNGTPMSWMALDNDQPIYIERGEGASFTDVDGYAYVDFNVSDMVMFCGHAHPLIVRAIAERAAKSTQFLLPTEDSIWVAEELARRYPLSHWQFTLSATQSNTEAIRLARAVTGREVVVLCEGHYHGHFEEGLIDRVNGKIGPLQRGLSHGVTGRVRIAQFNNQESLREALDPHDVAVVLIEPAMTNNIHLLLPKPGWHEAVRQLTREYGTLLALDETHTHVVGPGGATGLWGLEPDIITIGKAIAGGVPLGVYGVNPALADHLDVSHKVATGGTLFGNALSAAAARAVLGEVLLPDAYAHTQNLGARLADGIAHAIASAGLPWTACRFGPRSGQWYGPQPATGAEAQALTDTPLTRLMRIWLANRGIWEALPGAGPTVPIPATSDDINRYLTAYEELLAELTR